MANVPSADEIKAMSAGALRRALRDVGIDPLTVDGGAVEKMREALIAKLHPPAPARGRRGAQAAVPSEPASVPGAATGQVMSALSDAEWRKLIEMRLATVELAVGVTSGTKLDQPSAPSTLTKFLVEGPNKEQALSIEVDDIDELTEAQLTELARILKMAVDAGTPVRVLRNRLKQELSKVQGDADTATAGAAPAGATMTLAVGMIVKALWDETEYEPTRLLFKAKGRGNKWMVHFPDGTCETVDASEIVGPSTKPWELDELDESDF